MKKNVKDIGIQANLTTNLNNYTKPDPKRLLQQTGLSWVTNGVDNKYFYTIQDAYIGSPTATAIIDNLCMYIKGEELVIKGTEKTIYDIIPEGDLDMMIKDYVMMGAIASQVVYTKASLLPNMQPQVANVFHVPVTNVAYNRMPDIRDEVDGYWICEDWRLRNQFIPYFIPRFGYSEGIEPSELYYSRIPSPQPLFSLPSYDSGLQYMQLEEQLSNFYINHVQNKFQPSSVININKGIPDDPEIQRQAAQDILGVVQGTSNAGNIIVSFNQSKENETTVTNFDIVDAYEQYDFLSKEARTQIMLAFKINDPALFGLPLPSGFSSVADQLVTSLKILYRSQIKPMRRFIIKHLEEILNRYNTGEKIELEFVDFEELRVNKQPASTPAPEVTLAAIKKVGFDYDGTANTDKGQKLILSQLIKGNDVYLVSARHSKGVLIDFANEYGIDERNVYAVGSNSEKVKKVLELGLDTFFDNNESVVEQLDGIGKLI